MCLASLLQGQVLSRVQLVSLTTCPSPWLCPSPFPQSCSLFTPTPTLQCFTENLHPKCKNLHVLWLNFVRFLSAHISSLPSSLWTAGLPISILTAHPSVAASLPRMHSGPPSWSWIKLVNSPSPITNPEGMLLLTRCHLDFILLLTPLELGGPCNFPHFFIDHISHEYQKFDPTYRGSCGITDCPLL